MLGFQVGFMRSDQRTDKWMGKGKTICPRSFNVGASVKNCGE